MACVEPNKLNIIAIRLGLAAQRLQMAVSDLYSNQGLLCSDVDIIKCAEQIKSVNALSEKHISDLQHRINMLKEGLVINKNEHEINKTINSNHDSDCSLRS
jgi:hypothetical protein